MNYLKSRAEMVIDNLKNSNSGADIHEVANMRASARMLIDQIEANLLDHDAALEILKLLEKRQLVYFSNKFLK